HRRSLGPRGPADGRHALPAAHLPEGRIQDRRRRGGELMGILSTVGRKKKEVKLLIWTIYGILGLGSISIFIPLMVMLTLSVGSVTDIKRIAIFPRYFFDRPELFKKTLAEKYNEKLDWVRQNYPVTGQGWLNWEQMGLDLGGEEALSAGRKALSADWDAFLGALPRDL